MDVIYFYSCNILLRLYTIAVCNNLILHKNSADNNNITTKLIEEAHELFVIKEQRSITSSEAAAVARGVAVAAVHTLAHVIVVIPV